MLLRIVLFLFTSISLQMNAQIISQFSWDADPVTSADIGPDATSVSPSAISDVGGVGGTNGLNAGLPKRDVNMAIPGSPTFDVNGIDVSFDYQREESSGNFVQRGSSLQIRGCANLSVVFRVDDGAGGFTSVNSGNVFAIPNDDTFRNYRFYYLPSSGEAFLIVDGVTVWTYDGPDNRNMYWAGSGDMQVGVGIDGTGFNNTFMDNLIIGNVIDSPLPIELLNFNAENYSETTVNVTWQTASEIDNDYFTVERSANGQHWQSIGQVNGAGNSSVLLSYNLFDQNPLNGVSYYRLKQTDFNGDFTYSDPESVYRNQQDATAPVIFPNPAKNVFTISAENVDRFEIYTISGQRVTNSVSINPLEGTAAQVDVSALAAGTYIVRSDAQSVRLIIE